jgi:hypothetical protein
VFAALAITASAAPADIAACDGLAAHPDGIALYKRLRRSGNDDAVDALKRLRCPFTMQDKYGKTAGSICFDGKN